MANERSATAATAGAAGIDLSGQLALVTGSSRGIGAAIARRLHARGARCIVNYFEDKNDSAGRNRADAQAVAAELGGAPIVACDVGDADQVAKLADFIGGQPGGQLDILVNNAGLLRDRTMKKMTRDEWDSVLRVNLTGPFLVTKQLADLLRPGARVVNLASIAGTMGFFGQANYAASKAGLMALTRVCARELARQQVRVNAVAPGFIDTEMTRGMPPEVIKQFNAQIPLGRFGVADEVADVVLFLCSELSRYVTGQVIHVNGGFHMAD